MLAVTTLCLVLAGNASRGVANHALNIGCPAQTMPLLVGAIAWVPAVGLLVLTDRSPRPSAADIAARCARGTMSSEARYHFLHTYAGGLVCVCVAYALLVGIRSVRDLCALPALDPRPATETQSKAPPRPAVIGT